jgi:diguanylate cyclase (GGDEF)-like protein
MFPDEMTTIKPAEVLEFLRSYRFLEKYFLALYGKKNGQVTRLGSEASICGALEQFLQCGKLCRSAYEKAVNCAISRNKAVVFRCRVGLLNFAVPLETGTADGYCLVGGGLREKSIDLGRMESLVKSLSIDPFTLLEKLDVLPAASIQEVKEDAIRLQKIIASLRKESLQSRLLEKTMNRLHAVTEVSAQIDKSESIDVVAMLVCEAIGILFDIPKILIAVQNQDGPWFSVRAKLGIPPESEEFPGAGFSELFQRKPGERRVLQRKDLDRLFPVIKADSALCFPIRCGEGLVGILCLFDAELPQRDILLVELLCGRMSVKFMLLRKEEEHVRESFLVSKMKSLESSFSATESKEDLYRNILEVAAELLQASSGSLMLIDESGRNLRIESVKGMNPRLAKSMNLAVGTGIAGKVVVSGEPMLVNDIEQDARVGIPNRSRFKTKSFISLPLRQKGTVIGVLNLSDKKDLTAFTQTDLDLLTCVLDQASLALDKADYKEKTDRLEQLSINDPVTGLFNRRFMELRLKEELSRSSRHQQELSVMLIGLDNFTMYEDLCNSIVGNGVLEKTAGLLKSSARQIDVVTYDSGGKFCVILPGTAKKESLIVAERIRSKIECAVFPLEGNLPAGCLTASIGVASFPENGETEEGLLSSADMALQRAQAGGCNRVVHCAPTTAPGNKVIEMHAVTRQK